MLIIYLTQVTSLFVSAKFSLDDLSMMLNQGNTNVDVTHIEDVQKNLKSSKPRTAQPQKLTNQSMAAPQSVPKASPTKLSQLPVRKGSNLNKSLPRVSDSEKLGALKRNHQTRNQDSEQLGASRRDLQARNQDSEKLGGTNRDPPARNQDSTDSGYKGSSLAESVRESNKLKTDEEKKKIFENGSPRSSGQSIHSEELWASPNISSVQPGSNGLFDRLEEFAFSDKSSAAPKQRENLSKRFADELRESFKTRYMIADQSLPQGLDDEDYFDRKKTPPPDGIDRLDRNAGKNFMSPKHSQVRKGPDDSLNNFSRHGDKFGSSNSVHKDFKDDFNTDYVASDFGDCDNGKDASLRSERSGESDKSRLNTSEMDHGYMPGHHIPDGTAYSQRSDYAHMDHKGQSREDVAGVDDIGLAESRGFDMLKGANRDVRGIGTTGDMRTDREYTESVGPNNALSNSRYFGDKSDRISQDVSNLLPMNLKPTHANKSPIVKSGNQNEAPNNLENDVDDLRNAETLTNLRTDGRRLESWTQTSLVLSESVNNQSKAAQRDITSDTSGRNRVYRDNVNDISDLPPNLPLSSFKHNLIPDSQSTVPNKPNLLTKQSLLKTDFAQENLRRDFSMDVMEKIYSGENGDQRFVPLEQTKSDTFMDHHGRDSIESQKYWQQMEGRESIDTTGMSIDTTGKELVQVVSCNIPMHLCSVTN